MGYGFRVENVKSRFSIGEYLTSKEPCLTTEPHEAVLLAKCGKYEILRNEYGYLLAKDGFPIASFIQGEIRDDEARFFLKHDNYVVVNEKGVFFRVTLQKAYLLGYLAADGCIEEKSGGCTSMMP